MRQSSKISVDQFAMLNQGSFSRRGSLVVSNSQQEMSQKVNNTKQSNMKTIQRPSQYFLQAMNKKKTYDDNDNQQKRENGFDNMSLPCERGVHEEVDDLKIQIPSLKRSLSDINLSNYNNNIFSNRNFNTSKFHKIGRKSDFYNESLRLEELYNQTSKGLLNFTNFSQVNIRDEKVQDRNISQSQSSLSQSSSSSSQKSNNSENLSDNLIEEQISKKKIKISSNILQSSQYQQQSQSHELCSIKNMNESSLEPKPIEINSLQKLQNDKSGNLLISQDLKTPNFTNSKMKDLFKYTFGNQQHYSQQNSSSQKLKSSHIQDSQFKLKNIQQTQNSEYNPYNSIDYSIFNYTSNLKKLEISSQILYANESKQIPFFNDQIQMNSQQQKNKKSQQMRILSKKSSENNESGSVGIHQMNINKSGSESGNVNIRTSENVNPVLFQNIFARDEKSNFSNYLNDDYDSYMMAALEEEENYDDFSLSSANMQNRQKEYLQFTPQNSLKKTPSQVQNILQDLILNVSLDLQESENPNQNKNSLKNIEVPNKILKIINNNDLVSYQRKPLKSIYFEEKKSSQINKEYSNKNIKINSKQIQQISQDQNSSTTPINNLDVKIKMSKSAKINMSKSSKIKKEANKDIPYSMQQLYKNQIRNNPILTQKSKKRQISNYDFSERVGSPGQIMNNLEQQMNKKKQQKQLQQ